MNALLIISHGSRRKASNEEAIELADSIRPMLKSKYDLVVPAFLELATPSIPEGIKQCVESGAKNIQVVPYFLAAGTHVSEHIPKIVNNEGKLYSEVSIELRDHIGGSVFMPQFVVDHASA